MSCCPGCGVRGMWGVGAGSEDDGEERDNKIARVTNLCGKRSRKKRAQSMAIVTKYGLNRHDGRAAGRQGGRASGHSPLRLVGRSGPTWQCPRSSRRERPTERPTDNGIFLAHHWYCFRHPTNRRVVVQEGSPTMQCPRVLGTEAPGATCDSRALRQSAELRTPSLVKHRCPQLNTCEQPAEFRISFSIGSIDGTADSGNATFHADGSGGGCGNIYGNDSGYGDHYCIGDSTARANAARTPGSANTAAAPATTTVTATASIPARRTLAARVTVLAAATSGTNGRTSSRRRA